jgi:hypothetical protein
LSGEHDRRPTAQATLIAVAVNHVEDAINFVPDCPAKTSTREGSFDHYSDFTSAMVGKVSARDAFGHEDVRLANELWRTPY